MNPIAMLLQDNWHAFQDINGLAGHHPFVDALMVFSANDLIVALPLLLLGFWFLFARWSPLMRRAAAQGTPQDDAGRQLGQRMALLGCGAVALALAFNLALGQLLYEPRPFVSHPRTDHLLISHSADASFPSDHEAVAGAVAAILVLYVLLALGRWVRARYGTRQRKRRRRSCACWGLPCWSLCWWPVRQSLPPSPLALRGYMWVSTIR